MRLFTSASTRGHRGWPGAWRSGGAGDETRGEGRSERAQFLGSFLRNPLTIGAVVPSSPALARAMLADCDLRNARLVVELGPGTGSFTRLILERLGEGTQFFAVELDGACVERLRIEFDGLEVHHRSAEDLRVLLDARERKADCVISGLPWANMSSEVQNRILDGVVGSLSGQGVFTTFAYVHARWLPGSVRLRKRLARRFGSLRTSRVVWRNLPPAFVYCCRHPVAQE